MAATVQGEVDNSATLQAGPITSNGAVSANNYECTGSTPPTNGWTVPAASTVSFYTAGALRTTLTSAGLLLAVDLKLGAAGLGFYVKEGANATMGVGTLNGATEVTISTTKVTANSRIFLTCQAPGGTPLGVIYVSSRIAGTSFGVKGAATDTSTFAWLIVEPA